LCLCYLVQLKIQSSGWIFTYSAIAALPRVDGNRVSIQGTSLGGFIAASAAAVDAAFDRNFIALAGGDLYGLFQNGRREARMIRDRLAEDGVRDEALRRLCNRIDPMHLAHRLPPDRTRLISAEADQVVPEASARTFAKAAGLDEEHHLWLSADHYTAVLHLPWMIRTIADHVQADPASQSDSASSATQPGEASGDPAAREPAGE